MPSTAAATVQVEKDETQTNQPIIGGAAATNKSIFTEKFQISPENQKLDPAHENIKSKEITSLNLPAAVPANLPKENRFQIK